MTQEMVQAILTSILGCWQDLTVHEVKSLLHILAARGIVPKCPACDRPILDTHDVTWDHIFPHSKGGPDKIGNRMPMHPDCNVKKGSIIDPKYFCYIEPELLAQILKDKKKNNKRKRREERRKKQKIANDTAYEVYQFTQITKIKNLGAHTKRH